jgi:ABC-2 type transport system ATP-binding protein
MIEIRNVSKTYSEGGVKAVDGLSLTVPSGEIFGFLGPNGAGKSTTIKMLIGLLKQDSGTILMNGIDTGEDLIGVKQIIGYVPDEALFYEKMSGRTYLHFIADVFRVVTEDRDRRIDELSREFLLANDLDSVISSYSHGMKQKLGIIAALVHDPEIFILDEPMTGLDPKSAFILKNTMRRLCDQGKTVFFSTHVMDVAERICDRVAIIRKGRLIACAPFEELKKQSGGANSTLENIFLELTDETDPASV